MSLSSVRRTAGMTKYMVGAAITQEIIHELIQSRNICGPTPSARQVATPDTRNVMKNVVQIGSAYLCQEAGSFFTAAGTIWYGLRPRP